MRSPTFPATCMTLLLSSSMSLAIATASYAATPDSWAKLDAATQAACIKASGLTNATAGPPIRFSDKLLMDARVIEGVWPQPHMKGARASMLCLYNRKTKQVEVQELATPPKPAPALKDVWWQAEDIGGKGIIDRSDVTLMIGSDGKIGGKSGCNGYSASYQITDDKLKLTSPLIGTRMACAPALMNQEQNFKKLVETAVSFTISSEGALILQSADGATIKFVRK
jgi:heat shock protein HslJ